METEKIINSSYKEAVYNLSEEILENEKKWYDYVLKLPKHLQIVYTIMILHNQIMNGGFHQYFFNQFGMFSYLTIDNLRIIGASKTPELLEKALSIVNDKSYPVDEFRSKIFNRGIEAVSNFDDDVMDQLDEVDNEYYEVQNENVIELLAAYLENK